MKLMFVTSLLLSGLALGSCQKNESAPDTGSVAAQFSSVITRAVGNSWSANDRIGVFMTSSETVSASTILDGANNISYTVAAAGTNGVFSPSTADETIFLPQDGSSVTFVSYYPYGALNHYALSINLADQSNQEVLDVMSAAVSGVSKTAPNVALKFSRAMSKVLINASSSVYTTAQMTAMTVRITEMNTLGSFELSDRSLSAMTTPANIVAKVITAGSAYEAILFPEVVAAKGAKIEFIIDGKTLSYPLPTVSFAKGERYTYDLELGRISVSSLNSTITDWIDDTTINNGTAE